MKPYINAWSMERHFRLSAIAWELGRQNVWPVSCTIAESDNNITDQELQGETDVIREYLDNGGMVEDLPRK